MKNELRDNMKELIKELRDEIKENEKDIKHEAHCARWDKCAHLDSVNGALDYVIGRLNYVIVDKKA